MPTDFPHSNSRTGPTYAADEFHLPGVLSDSARKVLRNTYLLLAISMLPTVVGAALGVTFPLIAFVGFWGYFGIFLAGMFGFQFLVMGNRNSFMGVFWMLAFTMFLGYMIGPMLLLALTFSNGVDMIAIAFGGTAAMFFLLAGYATVTSRNFATPGVGKTLFIGMWMAFIMGLIGVAFGLSIISLAISAIFIPIASAYIVFTINSIVRGGETNYIMAAMTIFIMLFNIFQSLLHLLMAFGGRE